MVLQVVAHAMVDQQTGHLQLKSANERKEEVAAKRAFSKAYKYYDHEMSLV